MSEEKFSLNADPKNNYVNLILNDIRNFNFMKQNDDWWGAMKALGILLLDLPPAGQEYMKPEINLMYQFEKNADAIRYWEDAHRIFQKVMTWVWPNILQEYFSAKPRNPQPMTLGE